MTLLQRGVGRALAVMGQGERALGFLRRAAAAAEIVGGAAAVAAEARVEIAELLVERGDLESAATEMELARAGAGSRGSRYVLLRVCIGDAAVHLARRQWRTGAARRRGRGARGARGGDGRLGAARRSALAAEAAAGQGDRAAAKRNVDAVLTDPLAW